MRRRAIMHDRVRVGRRLTVDRYTLVPAWPIAAAVAAVMAVVAGTRIRR